MNIKDEIATYMAQINDLGFAKVLNLNSKQVSQLLGVSASTVENWRKQGIGIEYVEVGGRIFYPKLKIAEFMTNKKVQTA
ncbi:helix-turn-helix domain-containing protein [Aliarcobacter butzleri]|uniref:helix-turn-helix domain-containing protein n=1 Tax=Aliarcobacter butzleri TaxID=28197 RepID=UPI0021B3A1FE|nr:helix-turn-helix domain-containing protein [Aliarcobacter butzleri]MCT7566041.1 helix-turn-helix domain-containing protein [Aliarcobacter butzleri]MCT7573391.1 helix-turn-helix domain-containing protein [Aliarcobacter butzleri]